jgi:P27 family predicted phage terminase small subunit
MGDRPTPTAVKELRGTLRRDRANPAEPQPPVLEPGSVAPSWLTGVRRRRAWADLTQLLVGQRLLTVTDQAALAMLVDAYGDYLEAADVVAGRACAYCGQSLRSPSPCRQEPRHEPGSRYITMPTREGGIRISEHPAMGVRRDAWKRVVAMLDRFGMSPSARARVSAAAPEENDPMDRLLGAG